MEGLSSGLPPRSHPYLLLESHFTIPRASEMKAGAKSSLFLHPLHPGRYIDTNDRDSIKNINRNSPLPPSASHVFPYLGPSQPISAFSGDRSANADCAHVVLSCFIVSAAHQPYFSVPTCPSPNPILDAIGAGCRPVLCRSHHRPRSHSGGEPITVRASIVRSSSTHCVALGLG